MSEAIKICTFILNYEVRYRNHGNENNNDLLPNTVTPLKEKYFACVNDIFLLIWHLNCFGPIVKIILKLKKKNTNKKGQRYRQIQVQ